MYKNKKCVFLYASSGFALRYLLRSQVLKTLKQNKNLKIVILSDNADENSFRNEFNSKDIFFEKIHYKKYESYLSNNRFQRILIIMRSFILNGKYDTTTLDDFRKIWLFQRWGKKRRNIINWTKRIIFNLSIDLICKSKILRDLIVRFESKYFSPNFHKDLFEKYSPDLIVVCAISALLYTEFFAREAINNNVPVCSIILSWDNPSGLGMRGYNPDHIIAWTENMKNELIQSHDIDKKIIFVGGIAHFDKYYDKNTIMDRKDFYDIFNLERNKKTIFFATKSPKRFPWAPELLEVLAQSIENNLIKKDSQILVRIHPLYFRYVNGKLVFQRIVDEFQRIEEKYSFVKVNYPQNSSKIIPFDLPSSEVDLVATILNHSDIMLNMFSTMMLEAAIFDLPIINVCIRDMYKMNNAIKELSKSKSVKLDFIPQSRKDIMIDFHQNHIRRVLDTGGVRTAFTFEELNSYINQYLDNPSLDKKGRDEIVSNETGPYHGDAGTIIGEKIIDILN